jgi:thiol-disulfide isomerase/thioredoxin
MNQSPHGIKESSGPSRVSVFTSVTRLLLCTCLALLAACPLFAATSLLHKPAPGFSRSDFQHRKVDLSSYKGKVVLLDFWATWCAPCLVEIPHFTAWQKQYGPRGLQIVGVSMDDDPAAALKVYEKLKINYPVVMGDEKLGQSYGGVLGLPVAFLIDRRGVIQAQFQGEPDLNMVEKQIAKLLGQ